jgi:hypothetical protein
MYTECNSKQLTFQGLGNKKVIANFDGGTITSDAGALILREIDLANHFLKDFSQCFHDDRDARYTEHSVQQLVAQRILGICLGYEDLNDHEQLRYDPLFATLCGKFDLTGENRKQQRDKGKALAGKSTLNRLETASIGLSNPRYKKILYDEEAIPDYFVHKFLQSHLEPPEQIVLDFDATDDPLHGHQQGRFFHGYYDCYCYLPLYVFCGDDLLCAKLRSSNIDPSEGTIEELQRIVELIRVKWPDVRIIVRGDSGFCREEIMRWCEANGVDYLFGMARNIRLRGKIAKELAKAKRSFQETHQPQRIFKDFTYRTRKSWSHSRRTIGKAEYMSKGENPRFVVTSIPKEEMSAQDVYEQMYCARGDMENRIKEQQLYLFADRTSSFTMEANQLRLWFSSVAYVIMNELRKKALQGTEFAKATCETIRLKLLKIGAHVKLSVRRVHVRLASGYPYQQIFCKILSNLKRAYPQLC